MKTSIELNNIRIYAYHGCLEEEAKVGSDYKVDVIVKINKNISKKFISDNLSDTIDYVHINKIVKEEMKKRSQLLENVAIRIIKRIFNELTLATKAEVCICKLNPPIGGDVSSVCVRISEKRF